MFTAVIPCAFAEKGDEIAQKMSNADSGFLSESVDMEMIIQNAKGDKVVRKLTMLLLENDKEGDKSRITFNWPPDVKGTELLTHTNISEDDNQWLYLPALKKAKRITSRNKSGSFMGSEFSYEDLSSTEYKKFTYKFISSKKQNNKTITILERYPKDTKSGYSKQKITVDESIWYPLSIDYFDRKNELLKTATFNNYKKFGKVYRTESIEMINHQTKKKSTLVYANRVIGKKIDGSKFQKSSLGDK